MNGKDHGVMDLKSGILLILILKYNFYSKINKRKMEYSLWIIMILSIIIGPFKFVCIMIILNTIL
jgi:beta-lactamase regulating signal transducer with metallopeptidase domain